MLTSTLFLLTAPLVDGAVPLLANVPTSAIFCIFLICTNGSSTLSLSFLIPSHWLCKRLGSTWQTGTSSSNYWFLIAWVNYMMIDTCLRTAVFSYYWVYFISVMASSTPLTLSILSTLLIFPILSTPLTLPILCSPIHGTTGCNIMAFIYLRVSSLKRMF